MTGLRTTLQAGLQSLQLALDARQVDLLLDYLGLLQKWNKVYNLTAVRDPAEMMTHHLLDSLAAIGPLLRQTEGRAIQLLDVGSGGGLPGVVIAVACPQIDVTCVDTVAKKAAFIQQAAATLKLPNLRGLHARVESLNALSGRGFEVVCSRAFASLVDFTHWSQDALNEGGVWMAMKGKHPGDELATLVSEAGAVDVFHVEQLQVPGLDAERCIVWMRPGPAAVA
ncbi:MAG: 16S rRNA (guanine(527)-N(7))-methyltransferase RsmG [Hydrogenophaga sp.]|uniref:16S rRNA (guanine(527)-N(7))-methyltransferase RsmG n=1 Tax=Hydrogenophaga sp. TaxID=1904254 RepID=UPI0027304EDC|nr:16S rRNA (guanine(527)-N(7))-methyltransferase RsmG [Hydrogenophaga sp.]MDP2015198.1 16S rRNA (guanine(527)-N(7))-methyltransferase RsmG [Hydrogenophaga sp.]MDP3204718.1 16S rRNA (guanine(527)-N(7))-methyltransferase RsmG [Hydrogenophaga sp.]MDP3812516.1 16S rRNA (guanine(527)-N(7))-methyltransferase RsmG [Hydrogenophaga sp.]